MKRRFYGPDRDPVSRHASEDVLGRALTEELSEPERALLLDLAHGAPLEQVARRIDVPARHLADLGSDLLGRLRRSGHAEALRAELSSPRFSPEVVWAARDRVPIHRCQRTGCSAPPFTQAPTGRTRLYCSNRCKQIAYRERKKQQAAPGTSLKTPMRSVLGRSRIDRARLPYRITDYEQKPLELPVNRAVPLFELDYGPYLAHLTSAVDTWHFRTKPYKEPDARLGRYGLGVRIAAGGRLGPIGFDMTDAFRTLMLWPGERVRRFREGLSGTLDPAAQRLLGRAWLLASPPPSPALRRRLRLVRQIAVVTPQRVDEPWLAKDTPWFPLPALPRTAAPWAAVPAPRCGPSPRPRQTWPADRDRGHLPQQTARRGRRGARSRRHR